MTRYSCSGNSPVKKIFYDDTDAMITVECEDVASASAIVESVDAFLDGMKSAGRPVLNMQAHQPTAQALVDLTGDTATCIGFLKSKNLISNENFFQLVFASLIIEESPYTLGLEDELTESKENEITPTNVFRM